MNVISAILLNEHPVKGCIQDGNGNTKPFPIFAIDGLPLNIWISKNTSFKDANSSVPAHGWLYDFENSVPLSNAWKLLKPETSEYGALDRDNVKKDLKSNSSFYNYIGYHSHLDAECELHSRS